MSLPSLPEASTLDVATIGVLGNQLIAWAETIEDVTAVRDVAARWSAITEYVRRTSREGIAEAEAASRRLEMRIGTLLGPAVNGGDRRSDQFERDLTEISADARHDLRTLAEHAEVVEEVIAASDDASPPSRRKCLNEIARRQELAELVAEAEALKQLAPRIHAALAAMPDDPPSDWIVTLRFRGTYSDLVEAEVRDLGDEVSMLSIEEATP